MGEAAFSRWLTENGIEAAEVKTEFGGEEETNTAIPDNEAFAEPDEATIKGDIIPKNNESDLLDE